MKVWYQMTVVVCIPILWRRVDALLCEFTAVGRPKVLDVYGRTVFVKSRYVLRGYLPSVSDVDFNKRSIREHFEIAETFQQVLKEAVLDHQWK